MWEVQIDGVTAEEIDNHENALARARELREQNPGKIVRIVPTGSLAEVTAVDVTSLPYSMR